MAQTRGIPEKNIGVRVDYSEYPYKIGVFDHHLLSGRGEKCQLETSGAVCYTRTRISLTILWSQTKPIEGPKKDIDALCSLSFIPMTANFQVLLIWMMPVRRLFHSKRLLEDAVIDNQTVESHYTDELGNRLSPRKHDTLGKAIQLAQARLRRDSELFWKNAEYDNIVEEVLGL